MRWLFGLMLGASAAMALACDRPDAQAKAVPSRVVDSTIPRAEALRRFRTNLTLVAGLEGGRGSRDSLVAAYLNALGARDTAALAAMAVTRAEFGYLYYPTTPQGLPPYDLEPELMWSLLFQRSNRGIRRALDLYGGQDLALLGYDCGPGESVEGANTIWGPCKVRFRREAGDTVSRALFSQIIGRDGRYKFLSYSNKLEPVGFGRLARAQRDLAQDAASTAAAVIAARTCPTTTSLG
jgi:hypothetical protein